MLGAQKKARDREISGQIHQRRRVEETTVACRASAPRGSGCLCFYPCNRVSASDGGTIAYFFVRRKKKAENFEFITFFYTLGRHGVKRPMV